MKHSGDSRQDVSPDAIQASFIQHLRQGMTRKAALHLTIKQQVTTGDLSYLAKLPPSRVMAARLAVSRDTVEQTYAQLEAEGYIARAVGRGSFVSYQQDTLIGRELLATDNPDQALLVERELSAHGRSLLIAAHAPHTRRSGSLTPSLPDLRLFPIDSWLQLEKQAVRQGAERLLGYADPQGLVELREEIIEYLRRERGVKAGTEQVIVVTSSQQALSLCTQVLFNPGDRVFVEEPGYQGAKKLVQSAGLIAQPIEVDPCGMDIDALINTEEGGRGVYITPSHHYPLGHSLSIERRLKLLAWAQREKAWIIEDDYDSEFNYNGLTTAALQGLDQHQRTLYIGTFSKSLFPGLRIGFLIVPSQLIKPMVAAKQFQDGYTSALPQMTLFKFINEDFYAEHLRNMRKIYQARLEILHAAVHQYLAAWAQPRLPQGGLQLVCPLQDAATERRLIQAAAAQDMRVYGLIDFYTRTPSEGALVFGFAAYAPDEIVKFIKKLSCIFDSLPVPD
ncbi:PLP-dependent aminotransferase family protein [Serratia quinivorans]|uniref:MocR-like pyridoxine biosynthesis transcription factor PdxR n=1 Tax=Serratia quinivorans TaxID=137545 RepID=UPI00217AC153|nr:PLP-dependent aminotransferase family protein [Serratia quinivorans]CAI0840413.1 HTH-type transcriptional regulatory protein gabR [Serratia quinivorans]CAI0856250.1 HTH-type transcriptional regulatory protein gabR [Serratia quinivorans]CAI0881817.1 HTH-type transcriptional regulatory protein gabR [Serratia quinivorans]CAI1502666.1 HTH-type transcriptional regulatory protein gabR [Serratia quinivorans]CAI2047800.1 HTH-type transcriptional regulatory protein gabR [Serratia quinivorans]